jgi:hypothetical protein
VKPSANATIFERSVLRSRSASRLGYGKPATLEIREGGVLARSLTVKFAETRTASLRPKSPHPVPLPPGGRGWQGCGVAQRGARRGREAQNGEALAGEPSFALRVVLDTVDMDRPVRFDHTCSFVTKEVHDEAADRSLPAELRAQKLAAAHELPEHPFCRRLVSAKLARRPRPRSSHSLPSVVDASCFQNSRSRRPPSPAWRERAGVRVERIERGWIASRVGSFTSREIIVALG